MKLFKVTIRGGFSSTFTNYQENYQESYVVAEDSAIAYKKVREFLDKKSLCFIDERELKKIELLADTTRHGECHTLLFV